MHKLTLAVAGIASLATLVHAQRLVVPETMVYRGTSTTTTAWRSTAGRFQLMYDAIHFTNAGVTGPILINRISFRAEDNPGTFSHAERNLGGQVYAGAVVQLAGSPLAITTANMSTTWAANIDLLNMGVPEIVPTVTVAPAAGTVPNTYVIVLSLTTGAFAYDPTTGASLVIDVTLPTAPAPNPTAIVPMTASSVLATHRARINSAATPGALVGVLSATCPVVCLDFTGPGGCAQGHVPATVEAYGAACGARAASFYQSFGFAPSRTVLLPASQNYQAGGVQRFDLGGPNRSLTLRPDVPPPGAPNFYFVSAGVIPVDLTQAVGAVNIIDDSTTLHTHGFTTGPFRFPGGSTATFQACTNGYVWLASNTGADNSPTINELLGGGASNLPARVAPYWHDFTNTSRNGTTHPGSGMYVTTDVTAGAGNYVTYVTWKETGEFNTVAFGGHSVNTFQCAFHEVSGVIEFRYGSMDHVGGLGITGFGRGTLGAGVNATDPGFRDLSAEVPFMTTGPDGPTSPLVHNLSARPIVNTSVTLDAYGIPATTLLAACLVDLVPLSPGVNFAPLGPGCLQSLLAPATYQLFFGPPATVTSTPFAAPPGCTFVGVTLFTQYATLDASNIVYSSNALRWTLGYD